MKRIEKGYLIIFMLFALLVSTVLVAIIFQWINMQRAYEVAALNYQLLLNGSSYVTINYSIDMTVFNWIISAESAAIAIALPAQFSKKKRNNTDEYTQKWIDSMKSDPAMQPYIPQIIQTYLQTNPNS